VPIPPPTTRLREVEQGLGSLARELEEITGEPPANLLWWQRELRDVIVTLERRLSTDAHR
jgi:hypothetical protein